jgi:hypothetical protein
VEKQKTQDSFQALSTGAWFKLVTGDKRHIRAVLILIGDSGTDAATNNNVS